MTLEYWDSSGLLATANVTTDATGCFTTGVKCSPANGINVHWVVSSTCCKTAFTIPTDRCYGELGTLICENCEDCVKPPPNMTGWWQLDELTGSVAQDVAGGNACTWTGFPTPTTGQYVTNSTYLTNATDFMNNSSPNANANFGTGNFTIDAWVKGTNQFTSTRTIVDHRQITPGTSQYRGYSLFAYLGNLGLQMADGTGSVTFTNFISSGPSIWDGQWHHVAATVFRPSTTGGKLYVDGVPIYTFNPTLRPNSLDNSGPFRIGMDFLGASLAFGGGIDEVEIFKSTLSAQEILDMYTAGTNGKCKEFCSLLWDVSLWTGQASVMTNVTICNYNSTPQTYTWSMVGQPMALPNCTVNGPTVFTPPGGTVTVASGACMQIPVAISNPGGMGTGDVSCYQVTVINSGTAHAMRCHGSISASGPGTCASGPQAWAVVDVGNIVSTSFVLINMSGVPTSYPVKIESMPMDMSPELVVGLNGLAPGAPWTTTLTVAPHDSVTIQTDCHWFSADAFMTHSVICSLDFTGLGVWQAVASENLSQVHSTLASVDPTTGPGLPLGISIGPAPFSRSVEVRFALGASGATSVDILDVELTPFRGHPI